MVSITSDGLAAENKLWLMNNLGQPIQQILIGEKEIYTLDLSDLPNGVYIIIVKNKQNVQVQQVMKF